MPDDDISEKIDTFTLTIPSYVGIFVSILSFAFGDEIGLSYLLFLIPPLTLGWLMPTYIGYWRGSLQLDSIKEKVRGLVYFSTGMSGYIILLPIAILKINLPFSPGEINLEELPIFLFLIPFFVFLYFLRKPLQKSLHKMIQEDNEEKPPKWIEDTGEASMALLVFLYMFSIFSFLYIRYGNIMVPILVITGSFFVLMYLFRKKELEAREELQM